MPTIKVNDIDMYYEVHGSGEPLVLIAGLGVDHTMFRLSCDRLSQHYKVLLFDNRGAGASAKPDVPYTVETMANDTAALMDAVGIGCAYVLGVSLGGRIAMDLTLRFPEKVKGLLLVSTAPVVITKLSFWEKFSKRLRAGISRHAQPYYAFLRQLAASRGYDCTAQLGSIKVPTLIMQGRKDGRVLLLQAKNMHRDIQGSKLALFDGGHIFFLFRNEQFVDCVLSFLQDVSQRP